MLEKKSYRYTAKGEEIMFTLERFYLSLLIIFTLLAMCFLGGCKDTQRDYSKGKDSGTSTISVDSAFNIKERLGKLLFFEESLSTPPGQACSTCHSPEIAFADPESGLPVSKGACPGVYGNRNDMTITYVAFVPPLHHNKEEGIWVGGLFWDGRANSLACLLYTSPSPRDRS